MKLFCLVTATGLPSLRAARVDLCGWAKQSPEGLRIRVSLRRLLHAALEPTAGARYDVVSAVGAERGFVRPSEAVPGGLRIRVSPRGLLRAMLKPIASATNDVALMTSEELI